MSYAAGIALGMPKPRSRVPTLFRLLFVLLLLAGLAYGTMFGLATWLHPQTRQIEQPVDLPAAGRP